MASPYSFQINFKAILFGFGIAIIGGILYYSQHIVVQLQENSRNYLSFHAKLYTQIGASESDQDFSFFFNEVINRAEFPIIYTDAQGTPSAWKNISVPLHENSPDKIDQIKNIMKELDRDHEPIPLMYKNYLLGYFHFGDSPLIRKLRWLPLIEITLISLFFLIGFIGFSNIKKSEQHFIWVGMAKETAHQLGTPLSSLLGWIEILEQKKTASSSREAFSIVEEMKNDLSRLNKVAARFSQIGSPPDVKLQKVEEVIAPVISYFQRRLPQMGKSTEIMLKVGEVPPIPCNRDLFEWTLENLIKNSLDAIERPDGRIEIRVQPENPRQISIEVQDNGKGIQAKNKNDIFKPGYSTKKRGWGLGLTLARRIIEEYHRGKLWVKSSEPGIGTTIKILLSTS